MMRLALAWFALAPFFALSTAIAQDSNKPTKSFVTADSILRQRDKWLAGLEHSLIARIEARYASPETDTVESEAKKLAQLKKQLATLSGKGTKDRRLKLMNAIKASEQHIKWLRASENSPEQTQIIAKRDDEIAKARKAINTMRDDPNCWPELDLRDLRIGGVGYLPRFPAGTMSILHRKTLLDWSRALSEGVKPIEQSLEFVTQYGGEAVIRGKHNVRIEHIIDDKEAMVTCIEIGDLQRSSSPVFLISGMNTAGLADHSTVELSSLMRVARTTRDGKASVGSSTFFVLEPVDREAVSALLVARRGDTAGTSDADGIHADARKRWLNETYGITVSNTSEKVWKEIDNKSGKELWVEEEVARTADYVELFSPERKYKIRLRDAKMELHQNGKWEWVANGHWENRKQAP